MGRGVAFAVAIALLAGNSSGAASWEAELRLRHPDGREETTRCADFRFVFYDRRFIRKSPGFGKKGEVRVRDLPREVRFLQNDELKKVRFSKIRRISFDYREQAGERSLVVIITRRKGKPLEWPSHLLRNAATAKSPHFRGLLEGGTADFPLPPMVETSPADERYLVGIDFDFPGARQPRKRF